MGTILELQASVSALNLRSEVPKIIEQTKQEIADLNRSQLTRGLDSKGDKLKSYRSREYAIYKQESNPLPGFGIPDLQLTGSFYRGFNVKVDANTFDITSSDTKSSDLSKKYGSDIFGLTDQSNTDYAENTVFPKVKTYIETKTGLQLR